MKKTHTVLLLSFLLLCLREGTPESLFCLLDGSYSMKREKEQAMPVGPSAEVRSLRCNICTYSQRSTCLEGEGSCIAKNDEACATIYYYKRNKHLYSTHLCKYKCKEEQSKKRNLLRVTMCCYKNLCNIP